jgi:putative heme-binding domain-containing protein
MYENRYLTSDMTYAMPPATIDIPVDGPAAEVYRTSPDEPWRVIRTKWRVAGLVPGPIEGGGRPSGYFTGATGLTIYKGDALGDDFIGDAFIGDAGSNLVHRKKIRPNGVPFKAERPEDEQKTEFLTSTDNWLRPVQFANAPDGALYICDMYREVIEHPWSLPPGIKKHLDLNSGNDRGRIYRIVPEKCEQPKLPKLSGVSTSTLVEYLSHPNGWHRETAARLLYERQDKSAVEPLRYLLRTTHSIQGQIGALYALASINSLDQEDVFVGLQSPYADLRENALRVSESLPLTRTLFERYEHLLDDPSPRVRYQLTWTLSTRPELNPSLPLKKLAQNATDPWEKHAILAVLSRDPGRFFRAVNAGLPLDILSDAVYLVGLKGDLNASASALTYLVNIKQGIEQLPPAANLIRGLQKSKPDLIQATIRELDTSVNLAQEIVTTQAASPLLPDAVVMLLPDYFPANREKVLAWLSPKIPSDLQVEVIKSLIQTSPQTAAGALNLWPQLTPAVRAAYLDNALNQPRLMSALLNAVQKGILSPSEFSPAQVSKLRSSSRSNTDLVNKLFGQNQTSRAEAIRQYRPALELAGDPLKGKMVFTNICASCHRLYGVGNAVGPDLESVRSAGKESLFISILDPNREVAPRFAAYDIKMTNGDELSGILANETAAGYTLKQANGTETFIPRNQVSKIQSTGKSLMPEGLESDLTQQGLASLLAYILSQ